MGSRAGAALDYLYTKKDMAQLLKVLWDLGMLHLQTVLHLYPFSMLINW